MIEEYNFTFDDRNLTADLAKVSYEGDISEIEELYEIYNTHRTLEKDRPSYIRWFEVKAEDVINKVAKIQDDKKVIFNCCRVWQCEECSLADDNEKKRQLKLDQEAYEKECMRKQEKEDEKRRKQERLLRKEQERQDRLAKVEKERQDRLAFQEKERQDRLAMEALSKQEREARLAQEEQERLERLARAEAERLEKERLELLHKEKYNNLMKLENIILKKNPLIWKVDNKYYEVIRYDDDNNIVELKDVIDGKIYYRRGKNISSCMPDKKRGITNYKWQLIYKS